MKSTLTLIFTCIAVSFVGCDAKKNAPLICSKPDYKIEEFYLSDGAHCAVEIIHGHIECDWKDKKVKK